MDRPFRCLCGAPDCVGVVSGAKHLPPEALRRYPLAPHIRRLMAARAARTARRRGVSAMRSGEEEAHPRRLSQLVGRGAAGRRPAPAWSGRTSCCSTARTPRTTRPAFRCCHSSPRWSSATGGRIDGVASSSDYPGCLVAAAVAQELGLPGPAPEALLRCSHKYYSRIAQREAVPEATPRFALIDPRRLDRDAPGPAFPCFVKPVKSWFSVLAQPVGSFEELQAFAARPDVRAHLSAFVAPFNQFVARYSDLTVDGGYLLAEDLLRGDQVTVEGYVSHGEVVVTGIVDSVMFPGTISFQRFDYPSRLDQPVQARMSGIVRRVMRAHRAGRQPVQRGAVPRSGDRPHRHHRDQPAHGGPVRRPDGDGRPGRTPTRCCWRSPPASLRPARPARGRFAVAASFPLRAFEDRRVLRVPGPARLAEVRRKHPVSVVKVYCRPGPLALRGGPERRPDAPLRRGQHGRAAPRVAAGGVRRGGGCAGVRVRRAGGAR